VLLAIRSVVWALLLPGVVAGYVPWRFFGLAEARIDWGRPDHLLAFLLVGVGGALLGSCIVDFARRGRGTLSPLDPPKELVVRGLYRYVRNPMYLSVATILLGEVLLTGSMSLLAFAGAWFVLVNVFVLGYEEPRLRRQFGATYERYTRQVGRWIPSFGATDQQA
jgi:protein-S-isoprenylcysteine O-methyltransferase Ste14